MSWSRSHRPARPPRRAWLLFRLLSTALVCLLFAGHPALAATALYGDPGAACASTAVETAPAYHADEAGLPLKDHASPCQDHCKSMSPTSGLPGWSSETIMVALEDDHPVLFDPGTDTPPPQ